MARKPINISPLPPGNMDDPTWHELRDMLVELKSGLGRNNYHSGALVVLDSNQSIADSTNVTVDWDSEVYDDDVIWVSGNASRLTVPGNFVGRAVVKASTLWATNATGYRSVTIKKNGSAFNGQGEEKTAGVSGVNTVFGVSTAMIEVDGGDYFELEVAQTSGGALNLVTANATWFSIELYEEV